MKNALHQKIEKSTEAFFGSSKLSYYIDYNIKQKAKKHD